MEEFPPPQSGYDPKLQQVVPQLGPEDLAVAAEAAANAAGEMTMAAPPHAEVGAFEGDKNNDNAIQASAGKPPEEADTEPAAAYNNEHNAGQYTSTDVPVPPMMDWNHHSGAPPAAPTGQSMDLHSPIHVAPSAAAGSAAAAASQAMANAAAPNHNETPYASYAIPPGHMHPPPGAYPPPPHQYDPYAQWPHVYASPPGHMYPPPPPHHHHPHAVPLMERSS